MTVEYRVTRLEVARAMLQSRRTQRTLLMYGAIVAALFLVSQYATRSTGLTLMDVLTALAFGLIVVIAAPLIAVLFARTEKRVLTIDANGIETSIGKQHGRKPWTEIASIVPVRDLIVITGKNGNHFSVPRRAFASEAQRDQFIKLAQGWHSQVARAS